ncbi:hypothetical protein GH714_020434 [Hevea brasiliensis]|uniref:Alpha/beta hydrolase fold-3 domain-containing protein n=1 Tax=Hevea brasiliensis TaxID=3981 RepID=A0A6A6L758_HEVBR|nr:hypothetical protein GH714_020434 [Hevea brasiliensis]
MSGRYASSPRLPLKTRLGLATFSFAASTARRSNFTINRNFMKIFDPKAPSSAKPINGVSSFDITIDPSNNLWFRLYIPTTTSSSSTGDSAGGNIAHHVVLQAGEYRFSNMDVIGLITIQPFFGGEGRTESEIRLSGVPGLSIERSDWYWKAFLPEGADRNHPVVNVFGPNAVDISGVHFPATLVVIGGLIYYRIGK